MWHTPREERRIIVPTHEYRRGIRRTGLLLGAAFVAITIAGLAVSKAQALAWGTAAKPATTPSVSADALAQGLPKSMVFLGGFSSQRWPVVFAVARGAKQIPVAAVGLDLSCSAGEQFSTEDAFSHLDVAKNGKVHESDLIPPQGSDLLGGSHSLTGHLDRKHATFQGVWQLQLMFKAADGSTDTCQSGSVRVFAGL
jgi:hypothetical protein